jgi:tripartite-type tricarboxylate transporter receptor subunit TctC
MTSLQRNSSWLSFLPDVQCRFAASKHRPGCAFTLPFACCVIATCLPLNGLAQAYPNHPIRLIVPFPPGGGTDIQSRIVGQKLAEALGQQVVIDNRPGAGGSIGAELAAKAAGDGYTLWSGQTSNLAINPTLLAKIAYDPVRDFTPISLYTTSQLVLVVNAGSPVKSVKDLIAVAKASPGRFTFGSPGTGTVGHLGGEILKQAAGIDLIHVPYKGASPALTDLIGGQIHLYLSSLPPAVAQIKAGKIRAIGVSSATRSPVLPDLPTIAESGVPGYDVTNWWGMLGPAKMPAEIVARLNREVVRILGLPDVKEKLAADGGDVAPISSERFAAFIRSELAKWSKVIKNAGIKPD